MKFFFSVCCLFIVLLQGCNLRERETALQQKEASLNEREQQLLLKEKSLQLKEEELQKKQQQMDSTATTDSTAQYNPALVGTWAVQMTCTETSCTGSAVGDTKTESWELSYQDRNVIAKASVNNELVRVYSGIYTGNTLELVETMQSSAQPAVKIVARLQLTDDNQLTGQRQIERTSENCRIVYDMTMNKK